MEQIRATIKLEMESAKQTWWSVVAAPGMRRRSIVTVFLGLFTQLSGNSLISYYSSLLFEMMGYTTQYAKSRINIAYQCWSLMTAVVIAIYVTRFKRRLAFMTSAALMLLVFMSMTIAFYYLQVAKDNKTTNASAGVAALFFYFAYQPAYNIGNNALTYSKSCPCTVLSCKTLTVGLPRQPIFSNSGPMDNATVESVCSSSSASAVCSSATTSTLTRSPPSAGSLWPFIAAG